MKKLITQHGNEKPSWFVVTEKDQMINPGLQETMAKNIKATVIKANASHVVMVSQPEKTPVIGRGARQYSHRRSARRSTLSRRSASRVLCGLSPQPQP